MDHITALWENAQSRSRYQNCLVVINYDFIVDNIEEDLLIDASMLHYAQIQSQAQKVIPVEVYNPTDQPYSSLKRQR